MFTSLTTKEDLMNTYVFLLIAGALLSPESANAASLDGTVQAVVTGILRLFQIVALGYLGKNAIDHVRNRPDAGDKTVSVMLGLIVLIGINTVWAWVQDKVR